MVGVVVGKGEEGREIGMHVHVLRRNKDRFFYNWTWLFGFVHDG